MGLAEGIISIFLIVLLVMYLRQVKTLVIPIRNGITEIVIVVLSVLSFLGITIYFANKRGHYLICLLAIGAFLVMWMKQGIASQGFLSINRGREKILWNEIEKVVVKIYSKEVKVEVYGKFMTQKFSFKKDDYGKIIKILEDKLPKTSILIREGAIVN